MPAYRAWNSPEVMTAAGCESSLGVNWTHLRVSKDGSIPWSRAIHLTACDNRSPWARACSTCRIASVRVNMVVGTGVIR